MDKRDLLEPLTDEDGEVRELTEADFAVAMSFDQLPSSLQAKLRAIQDAASQTQRVSLPIATDVLARYQATGEGWQDRLNQALREWIESNPPA